MTMEYYMGEDPMYNFDAKKAFRMTEDEVMEAAESDPDALPTDKEFWKDAKLVEPTNYDKFIQRLATDAGITFESAKAMGLIELKRLVQENHKPYTPDPMDVSKVIANVRLQEAYSQGMFFREGF